MIPFSAEVLYAQFGEYNDLIWPAQIVSVALAVLALGLALQGTRASTRVIGLILALFWGWTAVAYHWFTFSTISFFAPVLAGISALQVLLLLWSFVLRPTSVIVFERTKRSAVGQTLALSALILYPMIGIAAGHGWPQMAVIGVTPPATVLFTLGLLLMVRPSVPVLPSIIPLLWSAMAAALAWYLVIPENALLPIGALVVLVYLAAPKTTSS